MAEEFNIKIKTVGFNLKQLNPRSMKKIFLSEYQTLRNEFYAEFNPVLKERNEEWEKSFTEGDEPDLADQLIYNQMISNYMNEIAFAVGMNHSDFYLFPAIYFGKGGQPKFMCRIKQHPQMSICDMEEKDN